MDFDKHAQLEELLSQHFSQVEAEITFTQWDSDSEDEEVTHFRGRLVKSSLTDNEFGEKDLQLTFEVDGEETVEILMEVPKEEADLGTYEEGNLHIFGTEAELVLAK